MDMKVKEAKAKVEQAPPGKPPLQKLFIYSLYVSAWTARGKDNDVTNIAKGATNVDAETDAGNFIKHYLPDCKELKEINSYLGKARSTWYNMTAPWGEIRNVRAGKIVSTNPDGTVNEDHMQRMEWVGDVQEGLLPYKEALGKAYLEAIEKAREKLQHMFKEEDYPPWEEVARRFSFKVAVRPLTNTNDIRVLTEIPEAERYRLEQAAKKEAEESIKESLGYAMKKLLDPVANLALQLDRYNKGETKSLHESLVENVREMCDAALTLNLLDDPIVTQFAVEAKSLVRGLSKKDLKDSDLLRTDKAKQAADLADRIGKFFQ